MRGNRPPWWTRSGYIEQVRDIAPGGGLPGALRDRDTELEELAKFCAGEGDYLWLKAGPWAGKSALLSTFVLNPPPQTEVASFFITARLAAQSDSTAFTDMLIDQLTAIVGEGMPAALAPAARDAHRRALLRASVDRLKTEGRRLVLVVDGLDEDRGTRPGSGLASVASLLPKICGDGLRIIVASRPNPTLPSDVPADHPLRRGCRTRTLATSAHAAAIEVRASRELQDLLHGEQVDQDIIGLVAASGGGLTAAELEELIGAPLYKLEGLLAGVFGRTIAGRADNISSTRVFLFTHEALRETAVSYLGSMLSRYRDRLHDWAQRYKATDNDRPAWSIKTPQYLLRGYSRMLLDAGEIGRLVDLVTDPARHDTMLVAFGGDAVAAEEIRTCQDALLQQENVDDSKLFDLTRLSFYRNRLEDRNSAIPSTLPAVWALLGQPVRAEALASGIADPIGRAGALAEVVKSLGYAGRRQEAEKFAEKIVNSIEQDRAFAALVWHLSDIGDFGEAERIADGISMREMQDRAYARLAQALFGVEKRDPAARIIAKISATQMQRRARSPVPLSLGWDAADPSEDDWSIEQPFDGLHSWNKPDPTFEAQECSSGSIDQAWIEDTSSLYRDDQAEVFDDVVHILIRSGEPDRAIKVASAIAMADRRASSLTNVAHSLIGTGNHSRAEDVAEEAERSAREVADSEERSYALSCFAQALINVGDLRQATVLADASARFAIRIKEPAPRAWALSEVLRIYLTVRDYGRAEKLFRDVVSDEEIDVHDVMYDIVDMLAQAGELQRFRGLVGDAREDSNDRYRIDDIAEIFDDRQSPVVTQSLGEATQSLDTIERIARNMPDHGKRAWHLILLAEELYKKGDQERAFSLADEIEQQVSSVVDAPLKARILGHLTKLSQGSEQAARRREHAERTARGIPYLAWRAAALSELAVMSNTPNAGRLIGEALTYSRWYERLGAISKTYPQVLQRFAGFVLEGPMSAELLQPTESVPGLNSAP
ncbi:tetratricopeptide repeat protein [Actinoplanes auranticolor]|nr:hypothetical protein [Actinoplanes auranticolor]